MTAPAPLTREQLEERLANLHRASLELVQDLSIESLLQRIAGLACREVDATYAAVGVLTQDGTLEQFIPIGMTEEDIALMEHPPLGKGLIGVLMRAREPIRLPDLTADTRSAGFPPHHPAMKSFLGVPIRLGNQSLGQIYLTDKRSAPEFSAEDERVIQMLAAYAAVAISNARLYGALTEREDALTRRNRDLAILNELASTLAASTEVDEVLDLSLSRIVDYLGLPAGEIFIRDENFPLLRRVLHRGNFIQPMWLHGEFSYGEGLIGRCAQSGKPEVIELTGRNRMGFNKTFLSNGFQQVGCFPLTGRTGVLGVLGIATHAKEGLDERQVQLLSTISAWSGTAIENTRLNLQGKRLAVLEERERIGMDLHDGIIQSIYAVGLTLEHARLLLNEDRAQVARRINQAIDDLNTTIRDIRAYILDLRPRQLQEENLAGGLQRLVNEFRANTLVEAVLTIPPTGIATLPKANATALFHICQEAIANVAKHAHATRLEVSVWVTADRVLLEVSDDGRGMDVDTVRMAIGHGLANMNTRARNVGGDVEISSVPGEGTTVLAWVPITTVAA